MTKEFIKHNVVQRVELNAAAGQTTLTTDTVDMAGFDSCTFICLLGGIASTGTVTMTVQQSADDSTYNDLEGSSVAADSDDDDGFLMVEIVKPTDRYLQADIARGTADSDIDSVIAIKSKESSSPVTTGAVAAELHVTPAEGTA